MTGWIAQERRPGPAPPWFWFAAVALAFTVFGVLFGLLLTLDVAQPLDVERSVAADGPAVFRLLLGSAGVVATRILSAATAGVAVLAVAIVGHRLWHSPAAGLLAALLFATDPAMLALGATATPPAGVLALAFLGLAGVMVRADAARWAGAVALALAAMLLPALVLWSPALLALVLLRGHIYAAPKHLAIAAGQTLGALALGAALGLVLGAGWPDCLRPGHLDGLVLGSIPALGGGSRHALHNPAVWFGGLGTLLFLAGGALVQTVGRFRLQRLPGRLQVRLPGPLGRTPGRALWLLVLALAAPLPLLWLPLFALALAGGIRELGEDARGFGVLIGVLVAGFALVYTWRLWGLVTGTAGPEDAADLLGVLPWAKAAVCT